MRYALYMYNLEPTTMSLKNVNTVLPQLSKQLFIRTVEMTALLEYFV